MKTLNNLKIKFKDIVGENNVLINEPMKNHTYFKVGGPADILVIPHSIEEATAIIKECKEAEEPYYLIGNGSNLLVKDGGIRGVVIKLAALDTIEVQGDSIVAECGAQLSDISEKALEHSLKGFEFACGIPGSIGGAVFMNAGAYDGEMVHVVDKAIVLDKEGNLKELKNGELELGYRTSAIMKYGYFVVKVHISLMKGDAEKIKGRIDELTTRRKEKQPLEYPSAGSTFKRPDGYFASKLIQDLGLKGYSIGGAAVSEKHSGFIINKNNATAKDVLQLIEYVQKAVKDKFNVELNTEVRIIGEELK